MLELLIYKHEMLIERSNSTNIYLQGNNSICFYCPIREDLWNRMMWTLPLLESPRRPVVSIIMASHNCTVECWHRTRVTERVTQVINRLKIPFPLRKICFTSKYRDLTPQRWNFKRIRLPISQVRPVAIISRHSAGPSKTWDSRNNTKALCALSLKRLRFLSRWKTRTVIISP